jgi:HD-GYP domain-containing protein (c-di-GMP phosphodiesterase class II)
VTPGAIEHVTWPEIDDFRARLRAAGMALLVCDTAGDVTSPSPDGGDWFEGLSYGSIMVHRAVSDLAEVWDVDDLDPVEAIPGLWFIPMPVLSRRRRIGYHIAIVFTERVLGAEQLAAMCQGARLDFELVRRGLEALPPASRADVPRLARLVRCLHADEARLSTEVRSVEVIGEQLAESYEEINFLYTIIQSMTVAQQPARFVQVACEELLATLSFRWIGARFETDHPWLKGLEGRFMMAGESRAPLETVRKLAARLSERAAPGTSMVLEPMANARDAAFIELGKTILVQPVSRDDTLIGILIAADKTGHDQVASSVDMKLLGATATHMSIFLENASLYEDLNAMFLGTLEALTASIDAKDRYTSGHSLRVAHLTRQLALVAGIDEQVAGRMHIAGLVHDVGKIGVPESVLTNPGKLSDDEFAWIRKHPEIGHRILKDIPQLSDILPGVLHHHERWDGRGYPAGLAGEDIPLVARIIALADSFDAMSSTRTYRAALSREKVMQEIEDQAGRQFDPDLAPLFLTLDFAEFDRLVLLHRATDQVASEKAA